MIDGVAVEADLDACAGGGSSITCQVAEQPMASWRQLVPGLKADRQAQRLELADVCLERRGFGADRGGEGVRDGRRMLRDLLERLTGPGATAATVHRFEALSEFVELGVIQV